MEDEIGLAVEQALPRSGDRLEMKVQTRIGTAVEETAQQRQIFRQRT